MHRILLFTVFTGVLLIGCDSSFTRPEVDPPDALAVTSILNPYADTQAVALMEVANPLPDSQNARLVPDASVQVGGILFDHRPATERSGPPNRYPRHANYRTDVLDVAPGSTYSLDVKKDSYSLAGTVTVPDTFIGRTEGRRLVWTESEGAARYHILVEDAAETPFEFRKEYTVTDTTVFVEGDEFTAGSYYVEITAQDPNLAAFMRDETDQAGVVDGYGVFGGQTVISGTVELTEKGARARSSSGLKEGAAVIRVRP